MVLHRNWPSLPRWYTEYTGYTGFPFIFHARAEETEGDKGDSREKIIEGNPVYPVYPVDCSHQDVVESPTHDGYVNRYCRDCGQNLGCRKAEPII